MRCRGRVSHAELTRLALNYADSPHAKLIEECKSFSMLHQETLMLLNHLARQGSGVVLEIGPYIGGSTVAIGEGLKSARDPLHVIVEVGGAYQSHPDYPSDDILADLKKRIFKHSLRGTRIIEGWSSSEAVVQGVKNALGNRKVDLLFIDADGKIDQNFQLYAPHLSDDCIIVLDDFLIPTAAADSKQMGVRQWVANATDSKLVRELGVYLWGTWVGQLRRVENQPDTVSVVASAPG
jgi:predicted O-methyltransferase YrrM